MATKGYNSYHGRTPLWKKILIPILVLLLLAGGAFLYCQNHLVYDENGKVHLDLPFLNKKDDQTKTPDDSPNPDDVDFTRDEPQGPTIEVIHATAQPDSALEQDVTALISGSDKTVVLTLKLPDGTFTYQPSFQAEGSVGSAVSTENLKKLTASDKYVIARISALGDTTYANNHVDDAGLLRTWDEWLWYDYSRQCWLDPAKAPAQAYLKQVCKDLADLGVDEIVLDNFGWPAVGNMDAMLVPDGTDKPAVLTSLIAALRETLPKTTALSVAIEKNAPENSGLTPAILALFDRIYADSETVDLAALTATLPADFNAETRLVQLTQTPPATGSYVIVSD